MANGSQTIQTVPAPLAIPSTSTVLGGVISTQHTNQFDFAGLFAASTSAGSWRRLTFRSILARSFVTTPSQPALPHRWRVPRHTRTAPPDRLLSPFCSSTLSRPVGRATHHSEALRHAAFDPAAIPHGLLGAAPSHPVAPTAPSALAADRESWTMVIGYVTAAAEQVPDSATRTGPCQQCAPSASSSPTSPAPRTCSAPWRSVTRRTPRTPSRRPRRKGRIDRGAQRLHRALPEGDAMTDTDAMKRRSRFSPASGPRSGPCFTVRRTTMSITETSPPTCACSAWCHPRVSRRDDHRCRWIPIMHAGRECARTV